MTQHVADPALDDLTSAQRAPSADDRFDVDLGGDGAVTSNTLPGLVSDPLLGGPGQFAGDDAAGPTLRPAPMPRAGGLAPTPAASDSAVPALASGAPFLLVTATDLGAGGFGGGDGSGPGTSVIDFSGGKNAVDGAAKPSGGGGKVGFTRTYGTSGGGLFFVVNYDSSVNSAPSGFVP